MNLCEFMPDEEEPEVKYKKCIKCKQDKPLYEFKYRNFTVMGKEETINACNDCEKKANKIIQYHKKNHPLPDSNYVCPGCELTEDQIKSRGGWQHHLKKRVRTIWRLDHCHDTGVFRAYICDYCNNTLGRALDNPATLRRLADYVEYHARKENSTISQNNP